MQTFISTDYGVTLRSKSFPTQAAAEAVAAKIQAKPAYMWAQAIPNPWARKTKSWIVLFLPKSVRIRRALRSIEQRKREERARTEGPEMFFDVDKVGGRATVICYSRSSGEYHLDGHGCTCKDAEKVNQIGLRCKHELAFVRGYAAQVA